MEFAKSHAMEARQSIGVLPESPWRTALEQLADYSVYRNH
jgi:geranylgeranyl pyrophosphate synthase